MRTFSEYVESIATDVFGTLGGEGMNRGKADALGHVMAAIRRAIINHPDFAQKLANFVLKDSEAQLELGEELGNLNPSELAGEIRRSAKSGKFSKSEPEAVSPNSSDTPFEVS